jgi:hypothetical protein
MVNGNRSYSVNLVELSGRLAEARNSPQIYRAAGGGGHMLKGEDYEETPEYGLGRTFEGIKGQMHSFKRKVEKNKWYHTGAC